MFIFHLKVFGCHGKHLIVHFAHIMWFVDNNSMNSTLEDFFQNICSGFRIMHFFHDKPLANLRFHSNQIGGAIAMQINSIEGST